MTPTEVAQRAKEQITSLTGLELETVSSLASGEDGWTVILKMVELKRIPESSDVLGTFEATVDQVGNVTAYRRTRRYLRADAMNEL